MFDIFQVEYAVHWFIWWFNVRIAITFNAVDITHLQNFFEYLWKLFCILYLTSK